MGENYWEMTTYAGEPLRSLERCDDSLVFAWMKANLPAAGTKIDWTRIAFPHDHWHCGEDELCQNRILTSVSERIRNTRTAIHAGDALSPFGVRFRVEQFAAVMGALLEIPEHHYVLAEDQSWLFVVTFEGDMDFLEGIQPTPNLRGLEHD